MLDCPRCDCYQPHEFVTYTTLATATCSHCGQLNWIIIPRGDTEVQVINWQTLHVHL